MSGVRFDKDEYHRCGCADSSGLFLDDGKDVSTQTHVASRETIQAAFLLVEAWDPYTAGHQRRVAQLARNIANGMGLSEWQATDVYIAGLLHDIGKIVVPMRILNKPGKLDYHEFSLIKKHPQVGGQTLEKLGLSTPIIQAVLQHHERLNGSGYPIGLSGESIILSARILAVADVVEAMSSWRPYRPALGLDQAIEEVWQQRDELYDPTVVGACLRLLGTNGADPAGLVPAARSIKKSRGEASKSRNAGR